LITRSSVYKLNKNVDTYKSIIISWLKQHHITKYDDFVYKQKHSNRNLNILLGF